MQNIILVHGCTDKNEFLSDKYPSLSNSHWFPWLQKEIGKKDIDCQTPEMPKPYAPEYAQWKRILEQFAITQDTVLASYNEMA